MTDRYNALTVILTHDIREDDAEPLIDAIRMLKGVASVQAHIGDHLAESIAETRVKSLVQGAILDALDVIWERKPRSQR